MPRNPFPEPLPPVDPLGRAGEDAPSDDALAGMPPLEEAEDGLWWLDGEDVDGEDVDGAGGHGLGGGVYAGMSAAAWARVGHLGDADLEADPEAMHAAAQRAAEAGGTAGVDPMPPRKRSALSGSGSRSGRSSSQRRRARNFGLRAERMAAQLLCSLGLEVLEANVLGSHGELDLVARDGEMLCFVEVKARRKPGSGRPRDSIGATKLSRLYRTARQYLRRMGRPTVQSRFDVVELVFNGRRLTEARFWPAELQPPGSRRG